MAAAAFETGGAAALEDWLRKLPPEPRNRTFVVGPVARRCCTGHCPPRSTGPGAASAAGSAARGDTPVGAIAPIGGALVPLRPEGGPYHVIIGPVRDSPRLFGELELPGVPWRCC